MLRTTAAEQEHAIQSRSAALTAAFKHVTIFHPSAASNPVRLSARSGELDAEGGSDERAEDGLILMARGPPLKPLDLGTLLFTVGRFPQGPIHEHRSSIFDARG